MKNRSDGAVAVKKCGTTAGKRPNKTKEEVLIGQLNDSLIHEMYEISGVNILGIHQILVECCDDRDYCNGPSTSSSSSPVKIFPIVLTFNIILILPRYFCNLSSL